MPILGFMRGKKTASEVKARKKDVPVCLCLELEKKLKVLLRLKSLLFGQHRKKDKNTHTKP